MTPLKYALVVYVALRPYAYTFFTLQYPPITIWLFRTGLVLFVPFVLLSLVILFSGTRKSFLIFLVTWIWAVLAFFPPMDALRAEVLVLGFRIHVWNVKNYLASSECELVDFVENGTAQQVGRCDVFDHDPVFYHILYDSTGEIAMPRSRRTTEWNDAMWYFPPKAVLRDGEKQSGLLFGNFYLVMIGIEEMDGDSTRPPSRLAQQR